MRRPERFRQRSGLPVHLLLFFWNLAVLFHRKRNIPGQAVDAAAQNIQRKGINRDDFTVREALLQDLMCFLPVCIFLCIPPVRSGNGRPSECFDAYAAQNDLRLSKEEIVISKIDYSITDLPEERLYEFQVQVLPKNANPAAGG